MKKSKIIVILIIICFALFLLIKISVTEEHFFVTENIDDYGTGAYPIESELFPKEITQDFDIIHFSYYDYWYEAVDVYLELKFDSYEKMQEYLSEIDSTTDISESFIITKNEYNDSYSDLFRKSYVTYSQNKEYTGYEIEVNDYTCYKCNYEVISYSYEELIVIHSYARGHFRPSIHKHTPEYLKRFNVPINNNHQRIFTLD